MTPSYELGAARIQYQKDVQQSTNNSDSNIFNTLDDKEFERHALIKLYWQQPYYQKPTKLTQTLNP